MLVTTTEELVNNVFETLELLESFTGRLAKESLLELQKSNSLLMRTFSLTFDPWKNWGVSKYDQPSAPGSYGHTDNLLSRFLDLLVRLDNRELKGNAARREVSEIIASGDELAQKWMERILWRNLRCGVSSKTVNKVWPKTIVPFSVSLAETLDTKGVNGTFTIVEKVPYPVRVEAKLDGLRCIAVKKSGEVTLYTRNGTVLETLPSISKSIEDLQDDDFVLDGEVMGVEWNDSASVIMSSKSKKDDSAMKYHVFDFIPLEHWQMKSSNLTYAERLVLLLSVVGQNNSFLKFVDHKICKNEKELIEFYEERLEIGYEGVMLKDIFALYTWKRSSAILKLKPVSTEEGVVIGWYNANKSTKRAGCFGGFKILTKNGAITRVGGGFKDKLKEEINQNPDSFIGKIVECEHQPPFTKTGALRFPVFCRFRDESDVDTAIIDQYEIFKSNNN